MWFRLVSGFLTEMTQQIHSLRASGVKPFQMARAARSATRTRRTSTGTRWTGPREADFRGMGFINYELYRPGGRIATRTSEFLDDPTRAL